MPAKKTTYFAFNTRVIGPLGEFIYLKKIGFTIPEYWKSKDGVHFPVLVDFGAKITISAETVNILAVGAAAAGSWQDMISIPFVNVSINPDGGVGTPFLVTLVSNRFMLALPDLDRNAGEPLDFECPLLVGDVMVNGVSVLRPADELGI